MTDDASAKRTRPESDSAKRGRAKNFPAAIPRTMTTEEQRRRIDHVSAESGMGTGATVRYLIELGLDSDDRGGV